MEVAEIGADAPAGVDPLLWLIIFLLFGPPALLWKFGQPMLNWIRSRKEAKAAKGKGEHPSFTFSQSEIERIGNDYKRLLADHKEAQLEADRRDERNLRRIEELETRQDQQESEITKEKQLRWSAFSYIRTLIWSHQNHAPGVEIPTPPPQLSEYF